MGGLDWTVTVSFASAIPAQSIGAVLAWAQCPPPLHFS
jgi:hypothetical protein